MDTLHSKLIGAAELLGPGGSAKDFVFTQLDIVHFTTLARKFIKGRVSGEIDGEVMVFLISNDRKFETKIKHVKPKKDKSEDPVFRSFTGQLPLPHKCVFDPPLTAEVLAIMAAAIND